MSDSVARSASSRPPKADRLGLNRIIQEAEKARQHAMPVPSVAMVDGPDLGRPTI
jgi:hypothetical protein